MECGCNGTCILVEDNFWELVFCLHHVGSENWTQVSGLVLSALLTEPSHGPKTESLKRTKSRPLGGCACKKVRYLEWALGFKVQRMSSQT